MEENTLELLLQAKNLHKSFNNKQVLTDISFDIYRSQIISVIGPNGAGKTTLLKLLLSLLSADSGVIYRKPGLKVSYLAQNSHINSLMPLTVKRLLHLSKNASAELEQVIEMTKIKDIYDKDFDTLSGGQTQRVLLARCLLRKPDLLILDEPASALDISNKASFYHLLGEVRDKYHTAILIVSHDLYLVMGRSDEVLCLNKHICCRGRPHELPYKENYSSFFPSSQPEDLGFYVHNHNHYHDSDGNITDFTRNNRR